MPASPVARRRWRLKRVPCPTAAEPAKADLRADAAQDLQSHRIDPARLITHRFTLDNILNAYDTFGAAAKTNALKVLIQA